MTILYALRLENRQTWRASSLYFYTQKQGGPVKPSGTGLPFHRLLRFARVGEGTRTHLHPGCKHNDSGFWVPWDGADRKENTASKNSSILCVYFLQRKRSPPRWLVAAVCHYVTLTFSQAVFSYDTIYVKVHNILAFVLENSSSLHRTVTFH
jgi:hypothetical protein